MAEYMNTRIDNDGDVVGVMVSKVGGGIVGESYDGFWKARIVWEGEIIWSTGWRSIDMIRTGTPMTHEEIVDLAMDFWQNGE